MDAHSVLFKKRGKRRHVPCKWLASGNHDGAGVHFGIVDDLVDMRRRMKCRIPAFLHIAPVTAHVTAANTDKIGRGAGMKTLSLNGVKFFHQWKHYSFLNFCLYFF